MIGLGELPPSLEAGSLVRHLGAGELLFQQGDRATAIYKGAQMNFLKRSFPCLPSVDSLSLLPCSR